MSVVAELILIGFLVIFLTSMVVVATTLATYEVAKLIEAVLPPHE